MTDLVGLSLIVAVYPWQRHKNSEGVVAVGGGGLAGVDAALEVRQMASSGIELPRVL